MKSRIRKGYCSLPRRTQVTKQGNDARIFSLKLRLLYLQKEITELEIKKQELKRSADVKEKLRPDACIRNPAAGTEKKESKST